MSFQEKSAIAMIGALAVVDGAYFAIVGRWLTVAPVELVEGATKIVLYRRGA